MSLTVTVQPSGHLLTVEENETILEAALRAGLVLAYGCTNGSCGQCKARVIGGEVQEVRFHDYVLNARERQAGFRLLCCTAPKKGGVVVYAERVRVGEIPVQSLTARVHKLERFGAELAVLSLRTPRSQVLRFLPGQEVSLEFGDIKMQRLPIASCPCDGMHLRFHLRRQTGDAFSEWVFSRLRRADAVRIEGPWGCFSLDEASRRPILLIAYDTGFGPASSLIEHAINIELPQPMHLYWYAPAPGQHYLDNQCRAWADALDTLTYTPLVVATDLLRASDMAGASLSPRACQALNPVGHEIIGDHPELGDFDAYLIGPEAFRAAVKRLLLANALPEGRLFEQTTRFE